MNTLSREITRSFFERAGGCEALETRWRALVHTGARRQLGPEHYLLYQALRGKDWRKAFTPVTNARKLANGGFYAWALHRALRAIHSPRQQANLLAPFGELVDAAALERVRALLPTSAAEFERGAYREPVHG